VGGQTSIKGEYKEFGNLREYIPLTAGNAGGGNILKSWETLLLQRESPIPAKNPISRKVLGLSQKKD
jgi:hypothetical protein